MLEIFTFVHMGGKTHDIDCRMAFRIWSDGVMSRMGIHLHANMRYLPAFAPWLQPFAWDAHRLLEAGARGIRLECHPRPLPLGCLWG